LGFFALKTAIKNKRKTSSLPDELVDAIEPPVLPAPHLISGEDFLRPLSQKLAFRNKL